MRPQLGEHHRTQVQGEVEHEPPLIVSGDHEDPMPGISSVNVVSPGRECTDSRPDIRSASSLAIASPSPDPWASSAV